MPLTYGISHLSKRKQLQLTLEQQGLGVATSITLHPQTVKKFVYNFWLPQNLATY